MSAPVEPKENRSLRGDFTAVAIIVALAVMCWAGYTTGSGMIKLMQVPAGAVIGTLAVMVTLAITSWQLGADLAVYVAPYRRSERPTPARLVLALLIFSCVFCISAFFSYTYYFRTVSDLGGTRSTAEDQLGELADGLAPRLVKAVNDASAADVKRAVESPIVVTWSENIRKIAEAAGPKGQKIEQKLSQLQQRARDAAKRVADLNTQKQAKEGEIEGYNGKLSENAAKLADLKKKHADAVATYTNAINGNDGSGVRGRGPRAKAAEALRDGFQRDIDQVTKATEDINALLKKAQTDLATIEDDIRKAQDDVPRSPAETGLNASAQNAGQVDALLVALARFREEPTSTRLAAVQDQCRPILRALQDSQLAPRGEVDCGTNTSPVTRLIIDRKPRMDARAQFFAGCTRDGTIIGKDAKDLRDKVHDRVEKPADALRKFRDESVEKCETIARNAGVEAPVMNEIAGYVKKFFGDNTLEANEFVLARRALFSTDNRDWPLALGIAVVQDLFILILKLFTDIFSHQLRARQAPVARPDLNDVADRDTDPDDLRATKALLRLHEAGPRRSTIMRERPELRALPPEVSGNIDNQINRWLRNGQARRAWFKNNAVLVHNDALADLEKIVAQHRLRQEQPPEPAEGVPTQAPDQAAKDGAEPEASAGWERIESERGITRPPATHTIAPAGDEQRASLDDYPAFEIESPRASPAQEFASDEAFDHVRENMKPFDFARNRRGTP